MARFARICPLFAAASLSALLCACAPPRHGGRLPGGGDADFASFNAADTDHNGLLDSQEVQNAWPELAPYFRRMDTDLSGWLSWEEVKSASYGLRKPDEGPPPRQCCDL